MRAKWYIYYFYRNLVEVLYRGAFKRAIGAVLVGGKIH
jgi:hypothetical protein